MHENSNPHITLQWNSYAYKPNEKKEKYTATQTIYQASIISNNNTIGTAIRRSNSSNCSPIRQKKETRTRENHMHKWVDGDHRIKLDAEFFHSSPARALRKLLNIALRICISIRLWFVLFFCWKRDERMEPKKKQEWSVRNVFCIVKNGIFCAFKRNVLAQIKSVREMSNKTAKQNEKNIENGASTNDIVFWKKREEKNVF